MSDITEILKFPTRITITTYNVWGDNLWPSRKEALCTNLQTIRSDIMLLQEVNPDILSAIEIALPKYNRVDSDEHPGWFRECNILWNKTLFTLVDSGVSDFEIENNPFSGLFWCRFACIADPTIKFFVSTARFPWVGSESEINTGLNPRIKATIKVCEHLRELLDFEEISIFGGDFNEDFHPLRILNEEMGMIDVFESLDLVAPFTHPVRPSLPQEEMRPNRTLDWITCNLPANCKVVSAFVKQIRGGSYPPPSDHMPVTACIEMGPSNII